MQVAGVPKSQNVPGPEREPERACALQRVWMWMRVGGGLLVGSIGQVRCAALYIVPENPS